MSNKGFLSFYAETEHIELHDGYFIDMKVYLPAEASEEAQRRMMQVTVTAVNGNEQEVKTDFNNGAYKFELAAQAVTGWNLTDENGMPLPVSSIEERRISVKRLPAAVLNKIVGKVKEEVRKDEADFPSEAAGGDSEGEGSAS